MAKPKSTEQLIISALRKTWYYSSLRKNASKAAKEGKLYRCYICNQLHEKVQIDHVDAVGSPKNPDGTYDWNRFINRLLFCSPDNVKAACLTCHKQKTAMENKVRKIMKFKSFQERMAKVKKPAPPKTSRKSTRKKA